MASQVVKIRREALVACMTCPLCDKLLREATTISLCLHTFCRKCIYKKLSDDEIDSCPVCDIDLGCVPEEKLRPDHSLQDIISKIFPSKKSKTKSPEVIQSITPQVKRKERSLSSLVVSAPKVSPQAGVTGKRSKFGNRKNATARAINFGMEKNFKKEELPSENYPESSSSDDALNKAQDKEQDDNNHMETPKPSVDLWKPLNCLVEAANRTKLPKFSPQDSNLSKSEPIANSLESKGNEAKEGVIDEKIQFDKNGKSLIPRVVKRKRRRAIDQNIHSPQSVVDSLESNVFRRACPIWLSLVATENRGGEVPLPPAACYLRIMDGDLPVSFIQKYLVKKLCLTSEAEVDILCHGQAVIPTLRIRSLVDLWSQLESKTKKIRTHVGSTGKEFVMALSYSRKFLPSTGE